MAFFPLATMAQQTDNAATEYLKGAVPVVDGSVVFEKQFNVKNKTKQQIFDSLLVFTQNLIKSENQLPQSRITETDAAKGRIVASIEETLYFKRKAWVSDFTSFYYQLIFECKDNSYKATMRRIRYIYEEGRNFNNGNVINAEDWITDEHAINSKGKLARITGKFRQKTIDRKNELFSKSRHAVMGGKKIVKRVVYVEEEEE